MKSVEHGEGLTGRRNCRCDLCAPLKNEYLKTKRNKGTFKSRSEESTYRKYKLSADQLQALIDNQDNKCAVCSKSFESRKSIRIDHDHSCCAGAYTCGNCVRGLLCHGCNVKIPLLEDRMLLEAAINYLGKYGSMPL